MIKRLFLFFSFFIIPLNTFALDFEFKMDSSLNTDYIGFYTPTTEIKNGDYVYRNTVKNKYLFKASQYNGGPGFNYCITSSTGHFSGNNCTYEKTVVSVLTKTGGYTPKVWPYTDYGTATLYDYTSTGNVDNSGSIIVNVDFINLENQIKFTNDFLIIYSFTILFLFLIILFFMIYNYYYKKVYGFKTKSKFTRII